MSHISRAQVEALEAAATRAAGALDDVARARELGYVPSGRAGWAVLALVASTLAAAALVLAPVPHHVRANARATSHARRALAAAQLAVREERAVAGLVEDALPALRRRARSVQRYVQAPVDSAQPAATREQALLDLLRGRATHATPAQAAKRALARASIAGVAACVAGEQQVAQAIENDLARQQLDLAIRARHQLLGQLDADEARVELARVRRACRAARSARQRRTPLAVVKAAVRLR